MSILLDALRKSEAQRRLGEVPTLETPTHSADEPRKGLIRWVPMLLCITAAAVILWMNWEVVKQDVGPEAPSALNSHEEADDPGGPGTSPADPAGAGDDSLAESNSAESKRTPGGAAPGATNDTPAKRIRSNATKPTSSAEEVAEKRRQLAGRLRSYEKSEPRSSANASETPRDVKPVPEDRDMAGSEAVSTAPAAPADLAEESYEPETISYWQIPQSLRDGLPELRITVLVWAEVPEDRFVLLNGQRVKEQETLESGLTLEEIRRDRAIFSYRNYRFHLKG